MFQAGLIWSQFHSELRSSNWVRLRKRGCSADYPLTRSIKGPKYTVRTTTTTTTTTRWGSDLQVTFNVIQAQTSPLLSSSYLGGDKRWMSDIRFWMSDTYSYRTFYRSFRTLYRSFRTLYQPYRTCGQSWSNAFKHVNITVDEDIRDFIWNINQNFYSENKI